MKDEINLEKNHNRGIAMIFQKGGGRGVTLCQTEGTVGIGSQRGCQWHPRTSLPSGSTLQEGVNSGKSKSDG